MRSQVCQVCDGLAGKVVENATQIGICRAITELVAEMAAVEPPGPTGVWHDVSNGLTVNGQRDGLTGADGVDDLTRAVSQTSVPVGGVLSRYICV